MPVPEGYSDICISHSICASCGQVKKIKGIYHTMNLFNLDVTQRCLIAECWCPVEDLELIRSALNSGSVSAHLATPPQSSTQIT